MLLVGPPVPDKSKVITQPRRDTLVLQCGGERGAVNPMPQKVCSDEDFLQLEKKLNSTEHCNEEEEEKEEEDISYSASVENTNLL